MILSMVLDKTGVIQNWPVIGGSSRVGDFGDGDYECGFPLIGDNRESSPVKDKRSTTVQRRKKLKNGVSINTCTAE